VPRATPPKLTSPAERADIAAGAVDPERLGAALKVLGIAAGDKRWDQAHTMLQQVAANYCLAVAAAAEETPARQIATLKAARQRVKAQDKQGLDPSPFFEHDIVAGAIDDTKQRHRAALPMALEMAIAAEIPAIELATPGLSMAAKHAAAIDAAIDRRNGAVSRGCKPDWPLRSMLDQLVAVAHDLDPSIKASHERQLKFISAFMEKAMGMSHPDIKHNRSRTANKLIPDLRRAAGAAHRRETKQAKADAAR
jgi:hypothetical protein